MELLFAQIYSKIKCKSLDDGIFRKRREYASAGIGSPPFYGTEKRQEKIMPDQQENIIRLRKQAIKRDFARMNPMQMQAVTQINGPVLILAGAGSGKTTVLVNRIANMVKYGDAYLSKVGGALSAAELDAAQAYLTSPDGTPPDALRVSPVKPWNIRPSPLPTKRPESFANELKNNSAPPRGISGPAPSTRPVRKCCAGMATGWGIPLTSPSMTPTTRSV